MNVNLSKITLQEAHVDNDNKSCVYAVALELGGIFFSLSLFSLVLQATWKPGVLFTHARTRTHVSNLKQFQWQICRDYGAYNKSEQCIWFSDKPDKKTKKTNGKAYCKKNKNVEKKNSDSTLN